MKTAFLLRNLLICLLVTSATGLFAEEEQDLIAVLQSSAVAPQKWAACQKLRVIGTTKAVPALAALLADEHLSQAARHALDGLPYPEASAALREALARTSGLLKAGVIDSLGWKGEQQSVPMLSPLLSDPDVNIAAAATSALGRIGGREAMAALSGARDRAPAEVQLRLLEALLKCAERSATNNDTASALKVYRALFDAKYPVQVRTAAWRGLALADARHREDLVAKALGGSDQPVQVVALKLLRETADRRVVQACAARWASLSPESQLAVLDAEVKFGPEAVPLVRRAGQSSDLRLRVAAWQALGELNDTTSIPILAKACAEGEATERDAARESLERLHGPGANEALLKQIESAAAPEKGELLRVLGNRGDPSASAILLKSAASDIKPVRLAALEALGTLAPPDAAPALLEMAAQSKSDDERGPVLSALYAACDASQNKDQTCRKLVETLQSFRLAQRLPLLTILPALGTGDALAAAQAASRDSDLVLAKEAVRMLSQWPNAAPAGSLLELAHSSADSTLQILALRGAIQVSGQEPDPAKRLALLQRAMADANREEEKRQVLGQLGQVPTPEALELALKDLSEPGLTEEVSLAALSIAEKLAAAHPDLADDAAGKVLARIPEGEISVRAWALRHKQATSAQFISNWLVFGPCRQAGAVGAKAVFDIPFAPEKPGSSVEWKTVPPADHVNLGALFPGEKNCAAYLRTRITSPEDCHAVLLMGSDDGVKAWLNGKVVHSNNVDRGEVADQDVAPISLKKGANELMLKITQGGGGWSASARIVGPDFKPIAGLQVACPKPQE